MSRARSYLLGLAGVLLLAAGAAGLHPPHPERPTAVPLTARSASTSPEVGAPSREPLAGIVPKVLEERWYAGVIWHAEMARQWYAAAERAARARIQRETPSRGYSGTVTGDCQTMKPAGFPDYIIIRESGGNPMAWNPSGAFGCAQLMPMHSTGDYQADWARLWNNGAGACNWDPPNYCAG